MFRILENVEKLRIYHLRCESVIHESVPNKLIILVFHDSKVQLAWYHRLRLVPRVALFLHAIDSFVFM